MAQNQALCCCILLPALNFYLGSLTDVSSSRHDEFFLVCFKKLFPQVLLLDFGVFKVLAWTSGKIADCIAGVASNDILEGSMSFSIGLFQKNNPKFALLTACKIWLSTFRIDYDVSIKLIEFPGTINAKPYQKIATLNISIFKEPLNEIWVFG